MSSVPLAWMASDGRVISSAQKYSALNDGGASASSVVPYTLPLYSHQSDEPIPYTITDKGRALLDGGK